jgi:carbamoylphosphate synthase small subunit
MVRACRGDRLKIGIREKGVPIIRKEDMINLGEHGVLLGVGPGEPPSIHPHVFKKKEISRRPKFAN